MNKLKIMIFNFMAIRKKTGLVPPTLHYCGHNAKKIGPKKSLLKIFTLHTVIHCATNHVTFHVNMNATFHDKQCYFSCLYERYFSW